MDVIALFCESLRIETNDSYSLVGVQSDTLAVPGPGLLPMLWVVIKITVTDPDEVIPERYSVRLESSTETLTHTFGNDGPHTIPESGIYTHELINNLTPFAITREDFIKVSIKTKQDGEYRLVGSLRILFDPSARVPSYVTADEVGRPTKTASKPAPKPAAKKPKGS